MESSVNCVMNRESVPLLFKDVNTGLSVFFATLCIIDIFGVFPVITLPRAIVQCGLFGIPLVFVVFALQIYTAGLLGKSWVIATSLDPQISRKNRYPFAAVTELTLGPRARTIVTILLDLTVFGGGIPNLLVASQNLQLFGFKVSAQKFDLSFCYWLLVVGVFLCPLMWLGSPRDMKWLAASSCTAVFLTAILIWWCIIVDDQTFETIPVPTSPPWDKFISGYGMLAFQFDVHPTLMTVQVDMRRPRDIDKAVTLAFLVSGSLFGITTGLTVWKYGGGVTANILQIVQSRTAIRAAILLAALQLCLSSAIGHSALFQHLEDRWSVQRSFGWKRCAMRSAVVFLAVAIGESVPRFDIVMALIGGTLTGPLVFILPPVMYAKAVALKADSEMRTSTPEVYSVSERRQSGGGSTMDPRIHSRSIYYGFTGMAKTVPHRYSYIYYENLDDDVEEGSSESDHGQNDENLDDFLMKRRQDDQPIFLDATQPDTRRNPRSVAQIIERQKFCSFKRVVNWFGYIIVLIGVGITVSSTYINVRNTIRYVRFTPPCIMNATIIQNPT